METTITCLDRKAALGDIVIASCYNSYGDPVVGGHLGTTTVAKRHFLLASDFDQTLSFNDSGIVLSELLGSSRFGEKVAGLSNMNLVQQGGELAYLLLHDPEYRCVRKEQLIEVGKRIRLKQNIHELSR